MRILIFLLLGCASLVAAGDGPQWAPCSGTGTHGVHETCTCFSGYTGANCDALDNLTVPLPNGLFLGDEGYHVWGSQIVKDDDGKYHMFASLYPKNLSFLYHWQTNGMIGHATSDTPTGPYKLQNMAVPCCGKEGDWDRSVFNPKIVRANDGTWLLFYAGATYPGEPPSPANSTLCSKEQGVWHGPCAAVRWTQRVGFAYSKDLNQPFTRFGKPVANLNKWATLFTNNAAAYVLANGTIVVAYMGYTGTEAHPTGKRLGFVTADDWKGPWIDRTPTKWVGEFGEDPSLYWENRTQTWQSLYHGWRAMSAIDDLFNWQSVEPPQLYSGGRTLVWRAENGTTFVTETARLERPQPHFFGPNGEMSHVSFAIVGSDSRANIHGTEMWNVVVPVGH